MFSGFFGWIKEKWNYVKSEVKSFLQNPLQYVINKIFKSISDWFESIIDEFNSLLKLINQRIFIVTNGKRTIIFTERQANDASHQFNLDQQLAAIARNNNRTMKKIDINSLMDELEKPNSSLGKHKVALENEEEAYAEHEWDTYEIAPNG
jgi:hypothetical protein